jgi:hypothetical protein
MWNLKIMSENYEVIVQVEIQLYNFQIHNAQTDMFERKSDMSSIN